jgi:RNA polymerase sigma-70 factor (ECF subfamily)
MTVDVNARKSQNESRISSARDSGLDAFQSMRRRLFGVAYRMLGSATEAEDVLQDVWLRWQATDRRAVQDADAFLFTIATRLSLTVAASARKRREVYVGPWLPEPVLTAEDPLLGAERTEALEMGVLLLLERLSPMERAVFLLREAFAYSFGDIAKILDITDGSARQHAFRARKHVSTPSAVHATTVQRDRLLKSFLQAAQSGDLEGLERLLADDVVLYSDGGGVVSAARRPVTGRANVSRFLAGLANKLFDAATVQLVEANGQTAFVLSREAVPHVLFTADVDRYGIQSLYLVMNPSKLDAVHASAWMWDYPDV